MDKDFWLTSVTQWSFFLVRESLFVGEAELELSSPLSPGDGEFLKHS